MRDLLARAISGWSSRNLWAVFSYPSQIDLDQYWIRYTRDGIANRVIRAYPDACWRSPPSVEDEQGASENAGAEFSAFTAAFEALNRDTRLIEYMHRADRIGRVGHYSILVLGLDDGLDLRQPVDGGGLRLAYLAVYGERSAQVDQWDEDPASPRFGLPLTYRVAPTATDFVSGQSRRAKAAFVVHWTRVVHIAENPDESEVFGEPALRPIWNALLDLEKVCGAGAETFWLNARGGLAIEAAADAEMTNEVLSDMKQQLDDYSNELRRNLAMYGAKVQSINTTVNDPSPNAALAFQIITGQTGIPSRILLGSERGELASSQDSASWEARVDERSTSHCSANILRPVVQRLIDYGVLPEPVGRWRDTWVENSTMTEAQRVDVTLKRAQAAQIWSQSAADRVIAGAELRIGMGLDAESEYELADVPRFDEDTLGQFLPSDARSDDA